MKTANEIERDFYRTVEGSGLARACSGNVYRHDKRPLKSRSEDIVVAFIAGVDSQIQEGTVIVNVYVPDIPFDGRMVQDDARVGFLEEQARVLHEEFRGGDYYVYKDGTPHTVDVDEISQHCIVIRLRFKLLTD